MEGAKIEYIVEKESLWHEKKCGGKEESGPRAGNESHLLTLELMNSPQQEREGNQHSWKYNAIYRIVLNFNTPL